MKSKLNNQNMKEFGIPGVRKKNSRSPILNRRLVRPRILIICEGKKTEPYYFRAFKITTDIYGEGLETIRVVEEAIRRNNEDGPFDQIWCVFDRDDFPAHDFDNAIHKVKSNESKGFRVAFSNEAFELWYILHFEFLQSALTRDQYCEKLNIIFGKKYHKGDLDNYNLVVTLGDENQAIKNAEKLQSIHNPKIPYSRCCPMTTVHELVKELRKIKKLT